MDGIIRTDNPSTDDQHKIWTYRAAATMPISAAPNVGFKFGREGTVAGELGDSSGEFILERAH
jgi:hypothetical protein